MKLVAGNSNRPLAEAIAAYLKTPLAKCVVRRFADMEIFVEVQENMRGEDVFVIQSTSTPANDNLMELLILMDALRRASARRITAVIPYFGYARQDRKPVRARRSRPNSSPTDHRRRRRPRVDPRSPCRANPGLLRHPDRQSLRRAGHGAATSRQRFDANNLIVVSPDVGGVVRARGLAKRIDAPLAIVDKRRERPGNSEVMNIIGRCRRAKLPTRRRYRRFRRHAGECRRGAARPWCHASVRIHHSRRAVRRSRRSHHGFAHQGTRHHQLRFCRASR